MKCVILMGSPRKNGNTISIVKPFMERMEKNGVNCELMWLYDLDLRPCIACRACQKDWSIFGCFQKDDMQKVFDKILEKDLIVLATPIYSWYCTPPMKAVLDRLVYGMNKYYGDEKGPSVWKGKNVALITTCGYRPEQGADLWMEGMKRYCKHSMLNFIDMYAERDFGYKSVFMDDDKKMRAEEYADRLSELIKQPGH